MSVLIKGIEIPAGNDELRLIIHSNGQVVISHQTYYEEAEAVPVPPHVWVSVADGLPEDGEEVLCWICNDAMGDRYATVGHYDTIFRMWDMDSEYALSRYVTHWMPLPTPPED